MKLLLCRSCADAFKLHREDRACGCGRSSGRYLDDGAHAVVRGEAEVIGLANPDVRFALSNVTNPDSGYRTVRAWLMGRDAPRVRWED